MVNGNLPLSERFAARCTPEPNTGCWLWSGTCDRNGYGQINDKGRTHGAHRIAWMLSRHADAPAGMDVCHRCDTPSCVNPDHLFLGTRKENIHDCWRKQRGVVASRLRNGERARRLTDEQIAAARALLAGGVTHVEISRRLGMSLGTVSNIRRGKHRRVA